MTERYRLGAGILNAGLPAPYRRRTGDPAYRPLRVFTIDPTVPSTDGAVAVLRVPWEPLEIGPTGSQIAVTADVDLNAPSVLIDSGLPAFSTNHSFHAQMLYAVAGSVCATFRQALGRPVTWSSGVKLKLNPHVADTRNAWYSPAESTIHFGYFEAGKHAVTGIPPASVVYTCLSHDIVAHEVTHAVVDGLRSRFLVPTGPDVLGFHEGFADLVAILQHFTFHDVVRRQIAETRGLLRDSDLLTGIAREFGYTDVSHGGGATPLRTALDQRSEYGVTEDAYGIGSILVSAVFDAFARMYERRTARFIRLAGRVGELHPDLVDVLAEEAARLARHFLRICIRALDYCPPVDLRIGEYLRALVTADKDLYPEDPLAYRETLVRCFAERKIYPADVPNMSVEALLWRAPELRMPTIEGLKFGSLRFAGDPASAYDLEEVKRQADALGEYVTRPEHLRSFGLVDHDADPPVIESLRPIRRTRASGELAFDLVAEVTQRRRLRHPVTRSWTDFHGGATVIIGPGGGVRYAILKRADHTERMQEQFAWQLRSNAWEEQNGWLVPAPELLCRMHAR